MRTSPLTRYSLCLAGMALGMTTAVAQETVEIGATPVKEPSFRRHIIPLLSRAGCSSRECHGSFAGQGGFQLSLFGYDFEADLRQLTQDTDGGEGEVRVNLQEPAKSLLVMKPTVQMKHKGKERFKKDSWEHQMLVQWIASGAEDDPAETGEFERLAVSPREIVFAKAGEKTQLKVIAYWKNGRIEDVTRLTRFRSNDDAVASISETGLVESKTRGDTHVVAFYDNGVTPIPVMLPVSELVDTKYPVVPAPTKVDELVVTKLRKLGIVPSELCTDAEFLRRVSLDVAGTLPTPAEVTAFLADKSPDKRTQKIDALLNSPGHAAWWATQLCDFTGNSARQIFSENVTDLNGEFARQWWEWIYRRVKQNEPYDKIVAGIVLATSRSSPTQSYKDYALEMASYLRSENRADFALRETMPYFWARKNVQKPEDRALAFAHAFLGVRIECAQCHKHPFDQWTKADYVQFQAFFEPVRYDSDIRRDNEVNFVTATKELRAAAGGGNMMQARDAQSTEIRRRIDAGEVFPIHEVYITTRSPRSTIARPNAQAYSGRVLTPKLLGGDQVLIKEYSDPREPLVQWLRAKDNPFFARAFVNRVWAAYFHRGLVDPADDINLANPPVNAELMEHLAEGFVASGYDMKKLHRAILTSDTYQRSWKPNATNELDEKNFSRFVVRRLPAEVLLDAMTMATTANSRQQALLIEVAERQIGPNIAAFGLGDVIGNRNLADYALTTFGKPMRETNCDCERTTTPTLLQSLYTRNDPDLLARIEGQQGSTPSWIAELRSANPSVSPAADKLDGIISEVFLRTVSRPPTAAEMHQARTDIAAASDPLDGVRDLLWVMLNTREFTVNH
ncbi:Ig-like protein group 2 [Roseimicrobium gellanilyticum]|uniref:Ig-like protein group 2 n=1 Tax=Roseimicrobium gellanilyticum TaxID=748857 RepID=A0A366HE55_9BACT|nr:DUF1549 and DUF1553 domain-containing protein [Roseimicrobium gellanilyticum]RBP40350.1 Ig-like protein group 2 [Roseimicrobium gellanilyticum]